MGDFKQTTLVFVSTLSLSALGLTWVAQAQTETQSSPFAKSGTQAWESGTTSSGNQAYQYPYGNTSSGTTTGSYQPSGNLQAPSAPAPTMTTSQAPSSSYSYQLPSISTGSSGGGQLYSARHWLHELWRIVCAASFWSKGLFRRQHAHILSRNRHKPKRANPAQHQINNKLTLRGAAPAKHPNTANTTSS